MAQEALRKNPSREECEEAIKRILFTEIAKKGHNQQFRKAADFMPYFESLYPSSEALCKQVQRAMKSLNLPKDEDGYFIINKTARQLTQEKELKKTLEKAGADVKALSHCEPVFIKGEPEYLEYLVHILQEYEGMQGNLISVVRACNGLLLFAEDPKLILHTLNNL